MVVVAVAVVDMEIVGCCGRCGSGGGGHGDSRMLLSLPS